MLIIGIIIHFLNVNYQLTMKIVKFIEYLFFNGFEKPKAGGAFFIFLPNWQKSKIEEQPPLAYNGFR